MRRTWGHRQKEWNIMGMRGVRGAITVEKNEKAAIWQAAKVMMQELIERNELCLLYTSDAADER